MTIYRAPRPKKNYTELDNDLLRNEELSFKARGILSYILSNTDNWATDALSIAKKSKHDGREKVQSGLKELEVAKYLHRRRWQNPLNGQWRTDSYVFDRPVEPEEVDTMLRPQFDDDDLDPFEAGEAPDWANAQVSPETGNPVPGPKTGFPASGNPASGDPASGDPTPEKPAVSERTTKGEHPSRRGAGLGAQGAGARERPAPPRKSRAKAQIPAGHDEFGPLSPKCQDHVNDPSNPPCRTCGRTREAYEAAVGKRAMAADRQATQDLLQAQNRAAASRTVTPQEAARVAREELLRRKAARSASEAPGTAGDPPRSANGSQEPVGASQSQETLL